MACSAFIKAEKRFRAIVVNEKNIEIGKGLHAEVERGETLTAKRINENQLEAHWASAEKKYLINMKENGVYFIGENEVYHGGGPIEIELLDD